MDMNIYLTYLATLISTFGFNTYYYICNRREEIKIKKRKLAFKKNLSAKTKMSIAIGDTIPSLYYFGTSLLSLIPIVNLAVPEISKRIYFALDIDNALEHYFEVVNDSEIVKRFGNGLSLKLMEECGYNVPDSLKKEEFDMTKLNISDELKEHINDHISFLYKAANPDSDITTSMDDIVALSDKEFNKRMKKSLKLTYQEDIDTDKINRITQI